MNLRFLRPDPDMLTVYGPANETYWLVLLVRADAIKDFKVFYYLAVIIEVLAIVAGFSLHIRGFVLFWKLRAIHINFLLIGAQGYLVLTIGVAARLLTIPYEAKIFSCSGFHESPIPYLAILRLASYAHAFYILVVWTIERTCATIYVADYEKNPRLHISVILSVLFNIASYTTGYAVVKGIVNGLIVAVVSQLLNLTCALWFRWLIRYNERRLARLTDHVKRHNDEYSLSLRVQLKENVWSMRKIEFGVYILIAGLSVNIIIIATPILYLTSPDQFELLQWFTCLGNLAFALSALYTSPWLEVAIAIHTGRVPHILRHILGSEYFIKQAPVPMSEIDSHFNQLFRQWNQTMNNRDS